MAQGLGQLNSGRFWAVAIPSYVGGAYTVYQISRLVREELWFRRAVRRSRSI